MGGNFSHDYFEEFEKKLDIFLKIQIGHINCDEFKKNASLGKKLVINGYLKHK